MNWKFWEKKKEESNKPKSIVREWWDAIVFAVVAATLIRWLIMEAYTIPTPSMENSLLVGDFLFVSKFHYGTRTPRTPLQIPLTHQKIWFTDIPSYLDWIQLPTYRLPGISHVKREDVVVFNVPGYNENNYQVPPNEWKRYPVDLKTNYIKRCVGIPGDVLEIKDRQLIVNGQPLENPENMQYRYHVIAKDEINARNLEKLGLDPEDYQSYGRTAPDQVEYMMLLSAKKYEEVKALPYIKSIELPQTNHEADGRVFPSSKYAPWNAENFGPLTIPKEGMTIAINDSTLSMYGATIRDFDLNKDAKIENGKLTIDGKEITQYTFKQNYYFMMGDNRDNSLDSRYWGFVPEDHIVGKGFFIWLSLDKYGDFFHKIRWKRFFKLIN
ncbi:MAG TPA: signal peptidase I [Cyclobacteriaceae bacterium]|jgi:signal peptidase I|nr:signal peptidase I [Cyclobacteriaceae bacterium]